MTKHQQYLLDQVALAENAEDFIEAFNEALQEIEPERRELITNIILKELIESQKRS